MDFKNFQLTLQEALRKRNFAYTCCALMAVSNVLLCGLLNRHEDKWILFPWPGNNGISGLELSPSNFSDQYLREFADRLTCRLLTMNPETIESRLEEFSIFSFQSGRLRKKLDKHCEKIKSERISTVFYAKDFSINRPKGQIYVSGDFHTYFGTDKAPVVEKKTVILTYGKGAHGEFRLRDFDFEEAPS